MRQYYDQRYFEQQADGAARSAARTVPSIIGLYPMVQSVVDIGCGTGAWLAVFRISGITDCLGVDASPTTQALRIPEAQFKRTDLEQSFRFDRRFDMAICFDVAEHVSAARARGLVHDICAAADTVLFGAAIPGQKGTHHINEQWQSYWAALFATEGFGCSDDLRPLIWHNEQIQFWYRQNILCYRRGAESGPVIHDLVHPHLWDRRRRPKPEHLQVGTKVRVVRELRRIGRKLALVR